MEKINRRQLGTEKEMMAARYLRGRGYQILEHGFRCRFGEIDLIALDGETLVFVEVKYRNSLRCGSPETAVGLRKQQVIRRAASCYLLSRGYGEDQPCRFDVAAIYGPEIRYIENAFGGI